MSGSQKTNRYVRVLGKPKDKGHPYRTSVTYSQYKEKSTFASNLFVQPHIIRNHEVLFYWDEICGMMSSADLPLPDYNADYHEAASQLGNFFRVWARDNLEIGLDFHVYGSPYNPRMQIFFQKKSDLVKWKLSWHGL